MIALVGCRRKQQQITAVVAKRLCKLEILGLGNLSSCLIRSKMMRLVKDNQIPVGSLQYFLDARGALERVDAGNQPVMLSEGIGFSVSDISFAAEHFEVEMECLIQFSMPIVHQTGRNDHQGARQFISGGEFAQDKSRLNCLAKASLSAMRNRRGDALAMRCVKTI